MATSHTQIRPPKRQGAAGRSCRPALNQRHSHSKTHARPNSSRGKTEVTVEEDQPEEDTMTITFPQYCAACDKQILIPSASILYCSEKCRKQDCSESPSFVLYKNDSAPPAPSTMFPNPSPLDIAVKSPQHSLSAYQNQPVDFNQYPSESLPSDSEQGLKRGTRRKPIGLSTSPRDTEASRYLAEFQSTDYFSGNSRHSRSSANTTPLLSLTPISVASASLPYTPRSTSSSHISSSSHNPRWSASAYQARSANLITPITQPPTAPSSLITITDKPVGSSSSGSATPTGGITQAERERLSYEKRSPVSGSAMSPGQSSLKQLFKFENMRS